MTLPRPSFSPENPYWQPGPGVTLTGQDYAYAWTWEVHMPHRAPHIMALVRAKEFLRAMLMQAFRADVKNQWRKLAKAHKA